MLKENYTYNDPSHGLAGPQTPDSAPADEDLGSGSEQPTKEPVKPLKKNRKGRKALQEVLGGDYLSQQWVTGNLSFILYVALLAMIYIANTYYTEKKFKSIEKTKNELKELRYEYITTKSILMFQGRQSEISKRAGELGLKEAKLPPYKILYQRDSSQKSHQ